ncbi:hypothetical protein A2U01_0049933, partial [Trifolium medium]|nr:hypothetical protein [Trifolium medium]
KSKNESMPLIANATPITTVPVRTPTKERSKSVTSKKKNLSKVSKFASASIKILFGTVSDSDSSVKIKKPHTMTDLYIKPLNPNDVEPHVDASAKDSTASNVEASEKIAAETKRL